MTDCYITSVKHMHAGDPYISVCEGYCWALGRAGTYSLNTVMDHLGRNHSGSDNLTVTCSFLGSIATPPSSGHVEACVKNTRANCKRILRSLITDTASQARPRQANRERQPQRPHGCKRHTGLGKMRRSRMKTEGAPAMLPGDQMVETACIGLYRNCLKKGGA